MPRGIQRVYTCQITCTHQKSKAEILPLFKMATSVSLSCSALYCLSTGHYCHLCVYLKLLLHLLILWAELIILQFLFVFLKMSASMSLCSGSSVV